MENKTLQTAEVVDESMEKEDEFFMDEVGPIDKIRNAYRELKVKKAKAMTDHPSLKVVDKVVKVGATVGITLAGAKFIKGKIKPRELVMLTFAEPTDVIDEVEEVAETISEIIE